MRSSTSIFFQVPIIVYPLSTFMFFSLNLFLISCVSSQGPEKTNSINTTESLIHSELGLAKQHLDRGQVNAAWENLRPLYQKFPDHPDVLNMVGLTHLALDNQASAVKILAKAYKLKPKHSYGLNLSSAYIAIGSLQKAKKIIKKMLQSSQTYRYRERLWHNYALVFEKQNILNEAVKSYKKALKINPNFLLTLLRLGKIYKRLNKPRTSYRYFQKAGHLCPSCFEAINEIAVRQINIGKYAKAVKILKKFIRNKKNSEKNRADAKNLLSLANNIRARQMARKKKKF